MPKSLFPLDNTKKFTDQKLVGDNRWHPTSPCNHAIGCPMKFGYTDIQAYIILGTAPVEGLLSGVVDIPNACSTIFIPRAIFDFDVRPSAKGAPHQVKQGHRMPRSAS
jgi:formamidase